MSKGRLEAFSDGVFAIIITIMVLDLKAPSGVNLAALRPILPVFIAYILSYAYIGIYWSNHHHMLQTAHEVNGTILLANLHLLFWVSLFPFVTAWAGQNNFARYPMVLYGVVLIMAAIAYLILTEALIRHHGKTSSLALAVGKGKKEIISVVLYALGIAFAFFDVRASFVAYAAVALLWLVPDRRMERAMRANPR